MKIPVFLSIAHFCASPILYFSYLKTIPSTNEHVGGNGHYGDCSQECIRKGNSKQNEDTFEAWLDQNSLGK